MPTPPRTPQTYDEILRQTVVEPDSSFRPSPGQEKAAYEGVRLLDEDEQKLYARVVDALLGINDLDPAGVHVEVERDRVTLRGRIMDAASFSQIERRVEDVEGVGTVVNYLVVGS